MNLTADRTLTAIMFADIVSYSRMMGENEEETLKILADFDSISIPIVNKFKGKLIKKNGDQIFCQFDSSKNAVDASLKIQNELASYNDSRPKNFKLEVRIGIHIGDVVKKDNDIFGDGVNVAARIQPLAAPGGVCISGAVSDALSSHPDYDIVSKGKQELKHIVQQHSIFELITGHERKIKIVSAKLGILGKLKNPFIYLPTIIVLVLALYFGLTFTSALNESIDNVYIDITSSDKYIRHYYIDYGFGSTHYYKQDEYIVSSIPDSLRNSILESVYAMITSEFSLHKLSIEASFDNVEASLLNELYFLKIMNLHDVNSNDSKRILKEIGSKIKERNNDYLIDMPDALVRVFIYKIHNIADNFDYYIWDKSSSWGEGLKKGYPTISWEEISESFSLTSSGLDSLIENIFDNVKDGLETIFFAEDKVYDKVGKVIEILENDMIKIKQDQVGLVKKKMKLSTYRTYFWAWGGAEIAIDDLELGIKYLKEADPFALWEKSDDFDKLNDYSEDFVVEIIQEQIDNMKKQIEGITKAVEDNIYSENVSTITGQYSYTMEVVDVIGDIVIAKVIDSKYPKGTFIYRLDDKVILTK